MEFREVLWTTHSNEGQVELRAPTLEAVLETLDIAQFEEVHVDIASGSRAGIRLDNGFVNVQCFLEGGSAVIVSGSSEQDPHDYVNLCLMDTAVRPGTLVQVTAIGRVNDIDKSQVVPVEVCVQAAKQLLASGELELPTRYRWADLRQIQNASM